MKKTGDTMKKESNFSLFIKLLPTIIYLIGVAFMAWKVHALFGLLYLLCQISFGNKKEDSK
jgi:hypothetical protein